MALNAVLNVVGISITRPKKDDEWSIADGRSLMRFTDGVVSLVAGLEHLRMQEADSPEMSRTVLCSSSASRTSTKSDLESPNTCNVHI